MIYNGFIFINNKDLKEYNNYLHDIKNGKKDDFISVGTYIFNNNFTIYVDLASGTCNYFIQYELVDNKGNVVESDVLDDFENFTIEDSKDKYIIHFEK